MRPIPAVTYERAEYQVSTDPNRLNIALIHRYLAEESYWAQGIARELVERSLAHSLNFGLYAGEAQIGFARVVTDYATYAYLNDVFVLAAWRGRGLGVWLVKCVVAHPALQTLRRFGLVTRDAQALYEKAGFRALRYPERHMEKLPPGYYADVP